MTESPLTVASIVDEVVDAAHGWARTQDERTALNGAIVSNATTLMVDDFTRVSRGPLEVDDELMQVASVDATSGTVTLEPWGRGIGGTTAANHSDNAAVTSGPLFPRQRVRNQIYSVLRETFPDIFAVTLLTQDGSTVRTNYVMPSDCWHVMSVETHLPDASQMWCPVTRWRQNKTATTVELEILGLVVPGTGRVRIRYMRTPPAVLASTDDLTTYGYDYQVRDLIVLGATAKLLMFSEASRVQASSVESHARSEAVPAGSAMNAGRMLYQMYQKRVADEAKQLQMRYPLQIHYTR